MDKVDLEFLKDELATQLNSYQTNNFSSDLLKDVLSEKSNLYVSNAKLDNLLSSKNEWESCVDSLENHALFILDDKLRIIRANRTIEAWGWGDVTETSGTHILNLLNQKNIGNVTNEWSLLNVQKNTVWESYVSDINELYRFSYYPVRDLDSFHHDEKCFATLLITNLTNDECLTSNETKTDHKNIGSRNEFESLLEKSGSLVNTLTEKLIGSQECERKRISSELHDGVGQVLSALRYQIESVISDSKMTLKQRKNDVILNDVLNNIIVALTDLKRISVGLGSSILDDLGLVMTLKWFVNEYIKVYTGLNVDLKVTVSENDIEDENKSVIYRVVQESMNNIAKHSKANNVSILLTKLDGVILLRIEDDGCGISEDNKNKKSGLGLKSMKERALNSNAKFSIGSIASSGTVVQLHWEVD